MLNQFTELLVALVLAVVSTLPIGQAIVSEDATADFAQVGSAEAITKAMPSEQPSETPAPQSNIDATSADGATMGSSLDSSVDPALLAMGRQVYLDNYCGVCHTLAAVGAGGLFGPPHDHIASVASERIVDAKYKGNARTAEEYIRESILEPLIYTAPGSMIAHQQMPPYTHLPAEEIDVLVLFLVQQR